MEKAGSLTRSERDSYIQRAQNGDRLAMQSLYQAYANGTAGTLSDIVGATSQALSDPSLARAKADIQRLAPSEWAREDVVVTGRLACEMVRHGVEAEYHGTTRPPPPAILRACARVGAWATMFIQSTRILEPDGGPLVNEELLDTMAGVLHAIFMFSLTKDTMQHPSGPLYDVVIQVYVRLLRSNSNTDQTMASRYATVIIAASTSGGTSGMMPRDPHPKSLWTALERHAPDLAGRLVDRLTLHVGVPVGVGTRNVNHKCSSLLQLVSSTVEMPRVRQELTARGTLPLLCRLFHKSVREEIDITISENMHDDLMFFISQHLQVIDHFLQGGHPSAAMAFGARILPNLLRTQTLLDDPRGAGKVSAMTLRQAVTQVMYSLEVQLFYRSTLRLFYKSERYVKKLLAGGSLSKGALWTGFGRLQSMAETRTREMAMNRKRCIACANPSCSSTAKSTGICIRRCSGCLTAEYCSAECHRVHWTTGGHRNSCAKIRSLRDSGSTLVPGCTRDMNFVYFLVAQEMERKHLAILEKMRQAAGLKTLREYPFGPMRGSPQTHPEDRIFADTVLVFDFAPLLPTQSLHAPEIPFNLSSISEFCNLLSRRNYCDFDLERFQESIRARKSRGPFVAIVSSSNLLDLTNRECIVNRVYSLDYVRK